MRQFIRTYKIPGLLVVTCVLLLAYTNCGKQQFSFEKVETFNPFDIEDIECKSMTLLTHPADGSPLVIPKRKGDGVCYSLKLASRISSHTSTTNPNVDTDLLANDHDKARTVNAHPRKLGEKVTRLYLEGPRAIKLSGSSDGVAQIQVDNIIVVGTMPYAQVGNPEYYKAYGTEDCRIWNVAGNVIGQTYPYNNTDGLSFLAWGPDHYPVPLTSYAAGGTASVDPWRIDGTLEIARDAAIDFRGLDCGGVGHTTDIYLTFE